MRIIPAKDSLYRCADNRAYIQSVDIIIRNQFKRGLIDARMNLLGSLRAVIREFWDDDLDVVIDRRRYCSICRLAVTLDHSHCYSCDRCLPSNDFNATDPLLLKSCRDCS